MSTAATQLRERLDDDELLRFMGAPDVMTAKLVEDAGFEGVGVQSFQTCTQRGVPDGMVTPSEYVDLCADVSAEVDLPILFDMMNGFGNASQATFWLRRLEEAGVAALHVEDLAGELLGGPQYVKDEAPIDPPSVLAGKIDRMVDERSTDLLVVARTWVDVFEGGTLEDAIDRLAEYEAAGADVLWVPLSVSSDEDVAATREALDAPLLIQGNPSGYYPLLGDYDDYIGKLSFDRAAELGVDVYAFPQLNVVGLEAIRQALQSIDEHGDIECLADEMWEFDRTVELGGYERYGMGYD